MNVIASNPAIRGAAPEAAGRRSLLVEATIVAALAGVLYTLSPVSAWTVVALVLIGRWAIRGLSGVERRSVAGVLAASMALRALAIAAVAVWNDPARQSFSTLFGDALYAIKMSLWIRNSYVGLPIEPRDYLEVFDVNYGRTSYHTLLAIVQVFLGPAPYGVHMLSVVLYLAGVVAMYRVARAGFGPIAAFIGLIAILFLPTLFLWSILPLKESVYFCCMAVVIAAVASLVRSKTAAGAIAALTLAVLALAAISSLRAGGLAIALAGLALGLTAALILRFRLLLITALIVVPIAVTLAVRTPEVHEWLLEVMQEAAARHLGHVATPGSSYRLLEDDDLYRGYLVRDYHSITFDEGVRFMARSVVAFVVVPKPWDSTTRMAIYLAPQQIAWYAMVLLACVGAFAGLRRNRLLTCLLVGNVLAGIAVIAPNSGNVGTLIRHRDMVVPFLAWLSGMGAVALLIRSGAMRPATASEDR